MCLSLFSPLLIIPFVGLIVNPNGGLSAETRMPEVTFFVLNVRCQRPDSIRK